MFTHALDGGAELAMLEPWRAEEFLKAVSGSREYLLAIRAAHTVHTLDEARAYLQWFADSHAKDTMHLVGIWLNGELVGVVQVFDFDTAIGSCELGVWLVPEARGRGLVTKSCRYVIDWVFRVRGLTRIQWTTEPSNERSAAVARRLGMTREGLLRSAHRIGGRLHDSEVWSVLAHEWPTPAVLALDEPHAGVAAEVS